MNQNETETLAQTLIDYVCAVTGIPDRKMRSNGGGDTGDAVYLRDGWASLEVVARIKERYFRKSEKQMLKIVCKILKIFRNMDLKPMHIKPTFVRNRTNNLLNKAQAMSILKGLEFIDPIDIVTLGGISGNPLDLVKRGLAYYGRKEGADDFATDKPIKTAKNRGKSDDFARDQVPKLYSLKKSSWSCTRGSSKAPHFFPFTTKTD